MNAPDRVDVLKVPEGEAAIDMVADEKISNAATFTLKREDHTLGNLLRMQLLANPAVKFAGYLHPHPLDHDIIVKVQTASGSTPASALAAAAGDLERLYGNVEESLRKSLHTGRAQEGHIE